MSDPAFDQQSTDRARVAGGAGMAFVGRMGALLEAAGLIAFTWAYGSATFGLFAALWSYVKVSAAVSDVATTIGLQRIVPQVSDEEGAEAVGAAMKFSFLISCVFSLVAVAAAPSLAGFINADAKDSEHLIEIIQLYAWVLPFWTAVEVGTSAIRAQRTFGPEIKVRIFYEQGIRLVAGLGFAAIGWMTFGLFIAHLVSVILSALLAIRLIARYYDIKLVLKAPMLGTMGRRLIHYGLPVMPSNLSKKLFAELPVMILNAMLPGAAGATAAAFYAIARKIASVLQMVRLTFEYVMAPLAAEKEGAGNRAMLQDMHAFATRMSMSFALPLCAALILAASDVLASMEPEFAAARSVLIILCLGRAIEALTGPATTIVEMLGNRMLPATNALTGLVVMLGLSSILIPQMGADGAAIAASLGINASAFLAVAQTKLLFKVKTWTIDSARPTLIAAVVSFPVGWYFAAGSYLAPPLNLVLAIVFLLAAIFVIIRFGLSNEDRMALGPIGKLAGKKAKL